MTRLIKDKKEIDKIINEKIKGKRLVFTTHYRISSAEKGIEDKTVNDIFSQFNKIYAIEEDTLKYGDIGYELFYKISENIDFSIATCPQKDKILIIHASNIKET